jgi:hypothetical protein
MREGSREIEEIGWKTDRDEEDKGEPGDSVEKTKLEETKTKEDRETEKKKLRDRNIYPSEALRIQ